MPGGIGAPVYDARSSCTCFDSTRAAARDCSRARRKSSIHHGDAELQLVEIHRGVGIDPALFVAKAQRPGAVDVPADADAQAVDEAVLALGVLPGAADLSIPGIPPA